MHHVLIFYSAFAHVPNALLWCIDVVFLSTLLTHWLLLGLLLVLISFSYLLFWHPALSSFFPMNFVSLFLYQNYVVLWLDLALPALLHIYVTYILSNLALTTANQSHPGSKKNYLVPCINIEPPTVISRLQAAS